MLMLFLTVATVHWVALMSPGPDFFFVAQTAMKGSRRAGMMGVLGITLGIMTWAAIALLGLDVLLQQVVWLRNGIQSAGGLYLCWLGWQLLRSSPIATSHLTIHGEMSLVKVKPKRILLRGVLTSLSNPKAVIYFGSVFSLFIGGNVDNSMRWRLFMLVTGETFAWFTLVVLICTLPSIRQGYQKVAKWIDRFSGVLLSGFGLHMIFHH